jgi:hypothetical protein
MERKQLLIAAAARKRELKEYQVIEGEMPGSRLPPARLAQQTRVVRIPKLLDESELDAIMDLGCHLPWSRADPLGGRSTAYLSANGYFGAAQPNIRAKLIAAAHKVDDKSWRLLRGRSVSPRCIEYHKLTCGRDLLYPTHNDDGSLLTMDVMLSRETDFDGGHLQTLEADGTILAHTFERGDALLFLSHKYHHVAPVLRGERRVLIMEIWEGEERLCPHRCTERVGDCSLGPQELLSPQQLEDRVNAAE